jgi:RNA polymerase sigma-70 factor (ECF subfamily)
LETEGFLAFVIQSTTLVNPAGITSGELMRACIDRGDKASWEEFVRRFRPLIAGVVSRTARRFGQYSPQLIDDLVQDTFLKLCANQCHVMRDFKPRAEESIFGLLKTMAFTVTHDHFRGSMAKMRGAGRKESALDGYVENTVAGRDGLPEVEREILLGQIDGYLASPKEPVISPRDREIFWLYYRHGMTARDIAAIAHLGLTPKGVESVIQRLTSHVRERFGQEALENPKGKPSTNSL